ncbi:MAG: AMP-binding protein, partial [bacterium]|nr:AMP-binding protein [bacterium]
MLIQKFEEQVRNFENQTAIKVENDSLTYGELNSGANCIAREIAALELPPDKHQAGVLVEHGAGMVLSLLGALKADMVYVPMDVSYPFKRLLYMMENSEASLIITNNKNHLQAERLAGESETDITVLNIDSFDHSGKTPEPNPVRNPQGVAEGEKAAYILYTSGSTGLPKGVLQNHKNVWYFTRNWIRIFGITPKDRMTLLTAFSHDGCVQDIFSALLSGAVLYPYDIKNAVNRTALPEFLKREEITIWHSVPTLFRYFADNLPDAERFPHLRFILPGGEALRTHDIEPLKGNVHDPKLANVDRQPECSVS